MKYFKTPRSWVITSFLLGFVLSMSGWVWWETQSSQTEWYKRGLTAYNTGDYALAVEDFDRSIAAFNSALSLKEGPFTVPASLEMAELAQFHKFKALLKMKNGELAVTAAKESLRLTTDWNLSKFHLSEQQLKKIREDRLTCQTDLEMLLHQDKEQEQKQGKGGKSGKPQQGEKQSEDPAQGNQAGKLTRDTL